jgi:hypothetical protein
MAVVAVTLASPERVEQTFEVVEGMVGRLERLRHHRASPRAS